MENKVVLEARSIYKSFHDPVRLDVLKDVSFQLNRGEYTSVIGRSGSGKSTLLYILSTMDTDFSGRLLIDGIDMFYTVSLNILLNLQYNRVCHRGK